MKAICPPDSPLFPITPAATRIPSVLIFSATGPPILQFAGEETIGIFRMDAPFAHRCICQQSYHPIGMLHALMHSAHTMPLASAYALARPEYALFITRN
jgi:hypothetical protein